MATGIGAQRRLRALANRGWPAAAIARRGGVTRRELDRIMARPDLVSPELAGRCAAAYDALWDRRPPMATERERAAAAAARREAQRNRWAPPMAYDDDLIDLPEGGAADGWQRSARRTTPSRNLAEDAAFVRQAGGYQTPNEVAMRLGVSRDALEKACIRAPRQQQTAIAEREAG